LTRKEAIGKFCYEITHHQAHPCSGDHHPCPLVQVLKTGKPSQATHIHLDKEDNELHYSISCYPFIDHNKITGVIEVSKDITSDIKIQKAMMRQEKMVSIGRLSAGVAHEINNPLTTILTSSMLLQEDVEPDSEIDDDEILDISAARFVLPRGPKEGEKIELEISFQSGKYIRMIIPRREKNLIDSINPGDLLKEIVFYSPVAIFSGEGYVSSKNEIDAGPKKGDYSLEIKIIKIIS